MSTAVAIIALPAASAVIWALLRSPLARRIVNVPTGDRWSAAPTPSLGGIGIFAGFTIGLWAAVAVGAFHPGKEFLGVFTAIALVFAAGLADDLYGMPPLGKLATQLVAASNRVTLFQSRLGRGPARYEALSSTELMSPATE